MYAENNVIRNHVGIKKGPVINRTHHNQNGDFAHAYVQIYGR